MCTIDWFWTWLGIFIVVAIAGMTYLDKCPKDESKGWEFVSYRPYSGSHVRHEWVPPVFYRFVGCITGVAFCMAVITGITISIHKDTILAVCHAF